MPNKMELVIGLSQSWRLWPGWPTSIALRVDDTGSGPWINRAVHGFLNVGAVAACKVAVEDTSEYIREGRASKHTLEHALKKMCKEGAYWGAVAGVYEAAEYGVERIRNRCDWTNAMIGGAITGALISAIAVAGAGNTDRGRSNKVIKGAITGGAVATAAELVVSRRRGRVASPAPFTIGASTCSNTEGATAGSWEWGWRHDAGGYSVIDDDDGGGGPLLVARGGLELPSSDIRGHIPGWPAGTC